MVAVQTVQPGMMLHDRRGSATGGSVLLVTAVPLRRVGDRVSLDDQTCAGLERWAESFDLVVYAGIEVGGRPGSEPDSSITWREVRDLSCATRLEFVLLPNAYRIQDFSTCYWATRARLASKVRENRYLCFTLGALVGDWGAVASLEAIRQRRPYAVWFDRVEHEVIRSTLKSMPIRRRAKELMTLPLMERYHRYLISRSALGLFQGQDCFRTYAPYAKRPFCVYDTHTHRSDRISEPDLRAKLRGVLAGDKLRICYVGRAAEMKGPLDWLRTIALARAAGVELSATWLGDGPLLETMKVRVHELGIADCVQLPGFQGDRAGVLAAMRNSHIFLFCHRTPEIAEMPGRGARVRRPPRRLREPLLGGTRRAERRRGVRTDGRSDRLGESRDRPELQPERACRADRSRRPVGAAFRRGNGLPGAVRPDQAPPANALIPHRLKFLSSSTIPESASL